jgi:hypothetical protein
MIIWITFSALVKMPSPPHGIESSQLFRRTIYFVLSETKGAEIMLEIHESRTVGPNDNRQLVFHPYYTTNTFS